MKWIEPLTLLVAVNLTFAQGEAPLEWTSLPPIPDELGVAGPFTGVHDDVLVVAGGANFPNPVWECDKAWHSKIYGLTLSDPNAGWKTLGNLPRALGYGACVSIPEGVVCIGGNDADRVYDSVFLLSVDGDSISIDETLPPLPQPLCYSAAGIIGSHIYVVGGQTGPGLETAQNNVWRLDWSKRGEDGFAWETLESWPGAARAFSCVVAQNDRLYLIGGRNLDDEGKTEFLDDVFSFDPATEAWTHGADIPSTMAAGTAAAMGGDRIILLAGADGSLFEKADDLKDDHPGFPETIWVYDTTTDKWSTAGETPQNQVTTHAVKYGESVFLASGEIRPRVRSPEVWKIELRR